MEAMNDLDFTLYCRIRFFAHRRSSAPNLNSGNYRPHLQVKGHSDYLGVCFIDGEEVVFDQVIRCSVLPLYETVDYSALTGGVSFFVLEGNKIVGEGFVDEVFRHRRR